MNAFDAATLRLKQQLKLGQDKDIAPVLGLTPRAWAGRKKRGAFPEQDLRALVQRRPDLALDVDYILAGTRSSMTVTNQTDRQAKDDALLASCWPSELELVNRLMASAFEVPRDPRSDAYRDGARALLLFKLVDKPLNNPFEAGTAHADAWWAGKSEGMNILKMHLSEGCPA